MSDAGTFAFPHLLRRCHHRVFLGMGKSIDAMGAARAAPQLIASMSFQLVIPGWVALQQSPLALRQPNRSCQNSRLIGTETLGCLASKGTPKLKTVKDVPIQTVKDVPILDTVFACWGGRSGRARTSRTIPTKSPLPCRIREFY
jgi:hypothetical protein